MIMANIAPFLAHALPGNQCVHTVDDEPFTNSSFGDKLDDV